MLFKCLGKHCLAVVTAEISRLFHGITRIIQKIAGLAQFAVGYILLIHSCICL